MWPTIIAGLDSSNDLFARPVLIRNLYFPCVQPDSVAGKPVVRRNYFISVYDEDTNKDGYISPDDLRRFCYFDLNGKAARALAPLDCSVLSSQYDPGNDRMYLFAARDANKNGQYDLEDPGVIFWIDLSNPVAGGLVYEGREVLAGN